MDNDGRANPYDLDSDMDGIADVIEAGFTDANFDGFVDGVRGADGWNSAINAQPNLNLTNTDTRGNPNYLDIDSDDDGIPDNVEGQTTAGYQFPTYLDTDNDGIDNRYDGVVGFGGSGIFVTDKDGDTIPDYLDSDTDADGQSDIIEGNDFNLNGMPDDNVALTLLDTDGDGLDNRFDSLNSVVNIKGTSYMMGTGGSTIGDATPGTRSPCQKRLPAQPERDWRYVSFVLDMQLLYFNGASQFTNVSLNWSIITPQEIEKFKIERCTDNIHFTTVITMVKDVALNVQQDFSANDNISNINATIIYYRLKVTGKNGEIKYGPVLAIKKVQDQKLVTIQPNPASDNVSIRFYSDEDNESTLKLIDHLGKVVLIKKQKVFKGENYIRLYDLFKFSNGVYSMQLILNYDMILGKLIIQNK